jgi:hypothetical protein
MLNETIIHLPGQYGLKEMCAGFMQEQYMNMTNAALKESAMRYELLMLVLGAACIAEFLVTVAAAKRRKRGEDASPLLFWQEFFAWMMMPIAVALLGLLFFPAFI